MSEPNSGSDLFAAAAKAEKVDGGYRLNGAKVWTSNAHQAEYMIGLFRTSPPTKENRRHGLTQFVIDMNWHGITTNPIFQMTGMHDFNEVVFDNVFVPDDYLLGEIDGAWKQATAELAYERSGPERFLETYYVLMGLINADRRSKPVDLRTSEGVGRLVAQLHTLRRMSVSVAGMLEAGKEPVLEASIVKDAGTVWEQELPSKVRSLAAFVEQEPEQRSRPRRHHRFRHAAGAEVHHPGRHDRGAARHHRPRPRSALKPVLRDSSHLSWHCQFLTCIWEARPQCRHIAKLLMRKASPLLAPPRIRRGFVARSSR